jgi:hypothetical protein
MPDRTVLLRELLELLHARANYLSIPELRGRTQQGKPADLTVRANVALACGADVRLHHGDPCIVKDPAAFDAAKQNGERMAAEAWDGLGHYFTSLTDIERHLLPDGVEYRLHRHPVTLTDRGPYALARGEIKHGGSAMVGHQDVEAAISPARALLEATLRYHAKEAGLDVA